MRETHKNKMLHIGLPIIAAAVVVVLTFGVRYKMAWSYFTTYATARGGYTFDGGPTIEEVVGARKDIQITTEEGTSPIYVRVRPIVAEEYEQYLAPETADVEESGNTWVNAGEYWYFTRALEGADQTPYLHVALQNVPKADSESQSFNIIVVYEEVPAVEGETYQTAWQNAAGGDA